MSARDRIPAAVEALRKDLGREPMLSEVADRVGVSRERVRQLYLALGLDPRAGVRQRSADAAERERKRREARKARRRRTEKLNAKIVALAESGSTIWEIADELDQSFSRVQLALNSAGIRRCWRFTTDEDEVVLDDTMTDKQIAEALNRTVNVIRERRSRLLAGASGREDQDAEILEAFDRLGSWRAVAREVGVTREYVTRVVRYHRGGWYIDECRADQSSGSGSSDSSG